MKIDETFSPIDDRKNFFKMTKARTVMFLVTIVAMLALIFSITDAYPTTESDQTVENNDTLLLSNNSRLVITNIVKTIEFEVGVLEDDGTVDENATASNVTEFYEADIQLLDVDLLKEVISQANATKQNGGARKETERG